MSGNSVPPPPPTSNSSRNRRPMGMDRQFESMSGNLKTPNLDNSTNPSLSNLVGHQSLSSMKHSTDNRFSHSRGQEMSHLHHDSSMGKMYMNYQDNQNIKEESFGFSKQPSPNYVHGSAVNPPSNISFPNNPPIIPSQSFSALRPPSGFGYENSIELLYNLMSNI